MLTSIGQKLWGKFPGRGTGYSPAPDCRPLAGLVVTVPDLPIFWFGGVFGNTRRVGDQANPSDQSLADALARTVARAGQLAGR